MKIPASIKVAAFDIIVFQWTGQESHCRNRFGEFSPGELTIRIDTSSPVFKIIDTFLHELNHAIWWAYGLEDGDKEERIASTMATAWTQIYRDNPEFLQWIVEMSRIGKEAK